MKIEQSKVEIAFNKGAVKPWRSMSNLFQISFNKALAYTLHGIFTFSKLSALMQVSVTIESKVFTFLGHLNTKMQVSVCLGALKFVCFLCCRVVILSSIQGIIPLVSV